MQLVTKKIPGFDAVQVQVTSSNLNECLREIKKQGYKYINLNPAFGWERGSSLNFLAENSWIEGLWIVDDMPLDLTPINFLFNLKFLGFSGSKYTGTVDFMNLPKLEFLVINWDKKLIRNFESCTNIIELHLYRWPHDNFDLISHFSVLNCIEVYFSKKLTELKGLEAMPKLQKVKLHSAPNLESIDSLYPISGQIKKLYFELCPKIKSYEVVDRLFNLEIFYIFKSSPLHSVQFIKHMDKLHYAYIGVDVIDKNILILKERSIDYKKSKLYL